MPDPNIDYSAHIQLPTQVPKGPLALLSRDPTSDTYRASTSVGSSSGSGDHLATRGNLLGRTYDVLTPATSDTDFEIRHDLGYHSAALK